MLTINQAGALVVIVEEITNRNPHKTGDVITHAMMKLGLGPKLGPIAKVVPSGATRRFLHNVENRCDRNFTWIAAIHYAKQFDN